MRQGRVYIRTSAKATYLLSYQRQIRPCCSHSVGHPSSGPASRSWTSRRARSRTEAAVGSGLAGQRLYHCTAPHRTAEHGVVLRSRRVYENIFHVCQSRSAWPFPDRGDRLRGLGWLVVGRAGSADRVRLAPTGAHWRHAGARGRGPRRAAVQAVGRDLAARLSATPLPARLAGIPRRGGSVFSVLRFSHRGRTVAAPRPYRVSCTGTLTRQSASGAGRGWARKGK